MAHGGSGGETFGERVRAARGRLRTAAGRRWTQGDLASAVGVERNTVSRWENGGVRPKEPATVAALARVLRVSTDWLIAGRPAGESAGLPAGRISDAAQHRGVPTSASMRGPDAALERLPPEVSAVIRGYIARLAAAGIGAGQLDAATEVLVAGAHNAVSRTPVAQRSVDELTRDVDAAWDFIARVLRREGIRA